MRSKPLGHAVFLRPINWTGDLDYKKVCWFHEKKNEFLYLLGVCWDGSRIGSCSSLNIGAGLNCDWFGLAVVGGRLTAKYFMKLIRENENWIDRGEINRNTPYV